MKAFLLLLFMSSLQLNAQTTGKNNFEGSRTYLLEIQQAVDDAPNSKKEKIEKLNKIISQATEQRRLLKLALKNTKTKQQQEEILQEFNLICKPSFYSKPILTRMFHHQKIEIISMPVFQFC